MARKTSRTTTIARALGLDSPRYAVEVLTLNSPEVGWVLLSTAYLFKTDAQAVARGIAALPTGYETRIRKLSRGDWTPGQDPVFGHVVLPANYSRKVTGGIVEEYYPPAAG